MADIDFGQLSEALNDKSDRDLRNVDTTAKADAVIDFQLPTAENNYTWYRKYKSGWVEQGGIVSASSEQTIVVSLPQPMSDANYHITSSTIGFGDNYVNTQANTFELTVFNQTQTGFSMHIGGATNRNKRSWQVSGLSAN